jgi:hypothetical protein
MYSLQTATRMSEISLKIYPTRVMVLNVFHLTARDMRENGNNLVTEFY